MDFYNIMDSVCFTLCLAVDKELSLISISEFTATVATTKSVSGLYEI